MFIIGMNLSNVRSSTEGPEYRVGSLGASYDGKVYKYVKFQNTTATVAAAAGSLVAYGKVADSGYENSMVVVDLSDADAQPLCAGAAVAAVTGTAATAYYGWIQIKGLCTLDTAVTNGTAGVPIYLTTTDKTAARANEADSAAAYKTTFGRSISTTTKVVLDCVW